MSRKPLLAFAIVLAAVLSGTADAATTATMSASFAPDRLGASAAITAGFQIHAPAGQIPSPLTGLEIHYPTNFGLITSGLGTASCPVAALEAHGPSICPPDSLIGTGSASVEIPVGTAIQTEIARILLLAAPSPDGYLHLSTTAIGLTPVIARVVLPSILLPGRMRLAIPLIESIPGAADISVVRVTLTLGGNLNYYEVIHGKTIRYRPVGIGVPHSCPRDGFPFSTEFSFLNGEHAQAQTTVRCPGRRSLDEADATAPGQRSWRPRCGPGAYSRHTYYTPRRGKGGAPQYCKSGEQSLWREYPN
jgi:hypothetical protein